MLNRAAGHGDLADRASARVEFDVRARRAFSGVISFDVAGPDVDIPHVASPGNDAAAAVVADVAPDDVRLVEIHRVIKDAHTRVLIEVTGGDQHVAISLREVHRMPALPHHDAGQRDLHRAGGFDAIGLGMRSDDLDAIHRGRALLVPDLGFHRVRCRSAIMRADEMDRRAGSFHDETCGAIPAQSCETGLRQVNGEGFCQSIGALGQLHAATRVDERLNGGRVVGLAIANGGNRQSTVHQRCEEESDSPEHDRSLAERR